MPTKWLERLNQIENRHTRGDAEPRASVPGHWLSRVNAAGHR